MGFILTFVCLGRQGSTVWKFAGDRQEMGLSIANTSSVLWILAPLGLSP